MIAVLLGLLAFSCIEEEIEQLLELKNSDIVASKSWYDAFEMQNQGHENARKVNNGKGKPDWAKSKVYHQSDGKKVIEVQFDFEEIAIPEHLKTDKFEKASVLQTLILFPKSDGSYVPYFLNIYPDSPDKKFKLKDFRDGGYQKIPSDFSGVYRFYRWNGDFISGWRIKDGLKTHRIKESKAEGSNKNSRLASSTLVCYQVVTTWYKSTCWEGFGCTTPVEDGTTVSGYECELVMAPPTPGDPGGGGGGGGTPPSTSEECEQPEGNLQGVTVYCDEEEEVTGIDCDSFRFKNTSSNWQEAAVANIRFNVRLSTGVMRSMTIARALYFGIPRENRDGEQISDVDASNFSAGAVQRASDIAHQLFVYDPTVQDITVENAFLNLLKQQMTIVGGRADFYGSGYTLRITNANYVLLGNGICW